MPRNCWGNRSCPVSSSFSFSALAAVLLLAGAMPAAIARAPEGRTIANPVAPTGHDPWVIRKDGLYYYCYSASAGIWVNRAARIEEAVQFTGRRVWTPEKTGPASRHLWAPELHFLHGRWYIYFAADDGDNANHRIFVLAARTADPTGEYEFKGQLKLQPDKWAIDGSILHHAGEFYFIWSGWQGDTDVQQDLFIARLSDPLTVATPRVLISSPEHPWEKHGRPLVNEGPTALYQQDKVFIVYSASGSWGNHYCLGLLTLTGRDPLQRSSWTKRPSPVFAGTPEVISPGHASFTKSPDGTEDWIIYHAAKHLNSGWSRNVRMQPFTWAADGSPDFGVPIGPGLRIPAPSERVPVPLP